MDCIISFSIPTCFTDSDINVDSDIIMRASHFGNPLITSSPGKNSHYHVAPPSPAGSTFSKNEHVKISNRLPSEQLFLVQHQYQPLRHNTSFFDGDNIPTTTSSSANSSSTIPHPLHVDHATGNSMLLGSTICTGSSIGLPSKYPGSSGHDREHSLESIVLEELQDFDEFFRQDAAISDPYSDSRNKDNKNRSSDDEYGDDNVAKEFPPSRIQTEYKKYDDDDDLYMFSQSSIGGGDSRSRESYLHRSRNRDINNSDDEYDDNNATHEFLSRIQNEHQNYDDGDDLYTLSRSQTGLRDSQSSQESFCHSRTVSELPSIGLSTSPYPSGEILEKARTGNAAFTAAAADTTDNRSTNHHHHKSSSSGAFASLAKSHRRSRNFAMGSSEFYDSLLKQL